jgi:hypothetical protein
MMQTSTLVSPLHLNHFIFFSHWSDRPAPAEMTLLPPTLATVASMAPARMVPDVGG